MRIAYYEVCYKQLKNEQNCVLLLTYCSHVSALYKRDGELHNVRDVKGGVKVIQRHANSRDVGGDRDERFAPMKSE